MKYQAYPKYKSSGVEWLGDIPDGWNIKRLKYLCKIQTGSKDTINAVDSGEYNFFVRSQTVEKIDTFSMDCEAVLTAGDGVGVGKVFHYFDGKFDFHQRVYAMYDFEHIDGKYFYYYIKELFHRIALDGSKKSTVDSLRLPIIQGFFFSYPDKNEQAAICSFLISETKKIDELIKEKEHFIELLQEKRQALISHSVTKGLNPDVKMKSSGVEWLGDVPEHWMVSQLKHQIRMRYGDALATEIRVEGDVDVFGSNGVIGSHSEANTLSPAIVVGRKGSYGKVVWAKNGGFIIDTAYSIDKNETKNNLRFSYYILQILNLDKISQDTGVPGLSRDKAYEMKIPVVPIEEQKSIADYLDTETKKIDDIIDETEHSITLLKEHRTALISAAVTGKIDVRHLVKEAA